MQCVENRKTGLQALRRGAGILSALLLAVVATGCGTTAALAPPPPPSQTTSPDGPQTYLAPRVAGANDNGSPLQDAQTYTIDDVRTAFSQSVYPPSVLAPTIINAGTFTASSRGLLSLGITANSTFGTGPTQTITTYSPAHPLTGGFALELANQAGGLVQLVGNPVSPLAAATQCPTNSTAQTYQFLTIPAALNSAAPAINTWNPAIETAYGSVDISASGSTVNLANIQQFTLPPPVGGGGAPSNPSPSSVSGACGSTAFGNTISIPGQVVVTNPGEAQTPVAQAIIGIGPTGLLVEDNGTVLSGAKVISQNALGAGTGAVGLPRPSSALDAGSLVAAQYLGFVYGAGVFTSPSAPTGWSSHLASFGFSSVSPSCAAIAASTPTLIYGGTFTNDDPSTSSNGFGNCDLAIDLGAQDPTNHGLFPQATVSMGAAYPANASNVPFHAVAIAGQLQGKFAIFLLGVDANQPWAIYLLQSN